MQKTFDKIIYDSSLLLSDLIAGNVLNVGNLQIHARFRNSQLFTQNAKYYGDPQ